MANFVLNIAKGRVVEFYNRVKGNDPSASALLVIPVEASGLEAQSVLEDVDTVTAFFAGATNEQTTMGRKTLTDADLVALPAPDDTNNRYAVALPTLTWTGATGNAIAGFLVAYDADTGAGTDANLIPLTYFDAAFTPDGSDIVLTTADFFRAA